jgi:hypothetical protein
MDELSNGVGAMELDSDLDVEAMKAFVKGMSANGGRHVTMDDVADEEQMRLEDASGSFGRGSESRDSDSDEIEEEGSAVDEEDEVMNQEEVMMGMPRDVSVSPSGSDDDEVDLSDEIDTSPNAGFQAKLQRLRENTRGKKAVDPYLLSEEDTSDDDFFDGHTRAEEDDDFIAHVEVCKFTIDENRTLLIFYLPCRLYLMKRVAAFSAALNARRESVFSEPFKTVTFPIPKKT